MHLIVISLNLFQIHTSSCDEESEVEKAQRTKKHSYKPTIFSKILDKSIPANILYEDEKVSQNVSNLINFHFVLSFT